MRWRPQSRHLADAGKWDDARTVLENTLSQLKDVTQIARIKAEVAHCAVERNTYFQKDEAIGYTEQAVQLAKSGNSPRALYSAHLTLAKLYFENGKTTEARQLADQSRAEAEAFGSAEDAKEAEYFLQKHP